MERYRFLIDNDSVGASALFPKDRVLSLAAVGLRPSAPDNEVVRKAWEKAAIHRDSQRG